MDNYEFYLSKVEVAFKTSNPNVICENIAEYLNFWNKDNLTNLFYNKKEHQYIIDKFEKYILQGNLKYIVDSKEIIEEISPKILATALVEQCDQISEERFLQFQKRIINNDDYESKIILAKSPKADFDLIEETILKSKNTEYMLAFVKTFPNKADIERFCTKMESLAKHTINNPQMKQQRRNDFLQVKKCLEDKRRETPTFRM